MGRLLQFGVLLASLVVLVGGVFYLRLHDAKPMNYRKFVSEPATFRTTGALFQDISHGDPAAIIQLGVLLLIATPIARVAFAAVGFAIERDRLYLAVSIFILGVLLIGFFFSK
jgi:uncharacterized membrane protein